MRYTGCWETSWVSAAGVDGWVMVRVLGSQVGCWSSSFLELKGLRLNMMSESELVVYVYALSDMTFGSVLTREEVSKETLGLR